MKKNGFFTFAVVTSLFIISCGKDEAPIDPMIGLWELDNIVIDAEGSEFDYVDASGFNSLVGETAHTVEFNADFSFERILTIPFSDGTLRVLDEIGVWEVDGEEDNLNLDTGAGQIIGIPYDMTVVSVSDTDLVLGYSGNREYFPQSKIDEWLADGTIDEDGSFNVSQDEIDFLFANYLEVVLITFTLEFEKQEMP